MRCFAEHDSVGWDRELLRRENDIQRSRQARQAPQHRPHYPPDSRLAILQLMRLRHWSVNGKAERFFHTFRIWQRITLFAWRLVSIQRRLDVYRDWYNGERPLHVLGCRTPDELWAGANSPATFAVPLRENDPVKPALSVERRHYRGDPNLIQLDIQIVRSVKRSA